MKLPEVINRIRVEGIISYDEIDENSHDYTYDEKIVALSGYLEKYVLMDSDLLTKKLKQNNLQITNNDAENIIEIVLFEEEENLFVIIDQKNKTNPYVMLKTLIVFPSFTSDVYMSARKFSLRNIILITLQMINRNLTGPVKTFKEWKDLGAKVKKGEKGIGIIVPNRVNVRRHGRNNNNDEMVYFNFVKRLFAKSQVDTEKMETQIITNTKDEIFDDLAEKYKIDLDLSEQQILKGIVKMFPSEERIHMYNFCALLTKTPTKNIYDTIAMVNETPSDKLISYLEQITDILK